MSWYKRFGILLCLGVGLFPGSLIGIPEAGAADEALKVDTGDTAWVLTTTALVLAMTMPGLALFYGGMVRRKNILGTIMYYRGGGRAHEVFRAAAVCGPVENQMNQTNHLRNDVR